MRQLRSRLTYANVTATLALVIAVAGGTAYAADTIGSSDVIDNSLLSADLKNNQAVRSPDVRSESLTGADIADQSGVDTCDHGTVRFGDLCVRAEDEIRTFSGAVAHCALLDLRLPTLGEALQLALTHDIPNVEDTEGFWTGDLYQDESGADFAWYSDDDGAMLKAQAFPGGPVLETVCVMTPTN